MSELSADVCVIGSGAGGGPVAATLAEAGYDVVVLERGPRYASRQFLKDEIVQSRRDNLKPSGIEEPQTKEWWDPKAGTWYWDRTGKYWNGNLVGGSSVLMSGFFLRMKPDDFRPLAAHGPVEGATLADWPIGYDDLEPYYDRVEREVGVSGRVVELPPALADRRSSPTFPQPPTREHPFAGLVDRTCRKMGLHPMPLPRAVLSQPSGKRRPCDYNGYCGSYGCTTDAKGSALAAWIPRAEATGRCDVRSQALVHRLESDRSGKLVRAHFYDRDRGSHTVEATVFVVACQAIETARLLLLSPGPHPAHREGLANASGQVGKNLVSTAFGAGWGEFAYAEHGEWLRSSEPFVNRVVQDDYWLDGEPAGARRGGTLNFLLMHPNPIAAATYQAFWDQRPDKVPLWGRPLKERLAHYFREVQHLKFEVFADWLPNPHCTVTVRREVKDKWGLPVANVREYTHPQSHAVAGHLVERGLSILRAAGAKNARSAPVLGTPSTNLVGGTCRFGTDPRVSVLDPDCRAHDAPNLYVTDGSFMPTGGTIPFTFTIYANALRVADRIVARLGGRKEGASER